MYIYIGQYMHVYVHGAIYTCTWDNTTIWEMFVVRIFSWSRQTIKIKCTNIFIQQAFGMFNFMGCHEPQKYFRT